jgi:hypothetical protein
MKVVLAAILILGTAMADVVVTQTERVEGVVVSVDSSFVCVQPTIGTIRVVRASDVKAIFIPDSARAESIKSRFNGVVVAADLGIILRSDSVERADGEAAGRAAAVGKGGQSLWWGLGASLVGGCCIGGLIPYPAAIPVVGMAYPPIVGGVSGRIAYAIDKGGDVAVPAAQLANKPEAYCMGFADAYTTEYRSRRSRNIRNGALIGTSIATVLGMIAVIVVTSMGD